MCFRARYGRSKTRFVNVPPDLDVNSGNAAIVHAALAAGLYPKILAIDPFNGEGRTKGEMRTIGNNQPASFHPSSVNFKRRLSDFGVNYLCYFTLMHVLLSRGRHIALTSFSPAGTPRSSTHGRQVL